MGNENRGQTGSNVSTTRRQTVAARQLPNVPARPAVEPAALMPVAGLLFLSGACGLIFQVAWFREFRLLFGASTAASSAVLAVFMGGWAWAMRCWENAWIAPAAAGLLRPLGTLDRRVGRLESVVIDALHGLYILMGGQLALGFPAATAVRLAIAALVLGIPTFLMGGTLPAAVRAVTVSADQCVAARHCGRRKHAGSGAGSAGQHVFRPRVFGTRNTLWLACLLNPGCGAVRRRASRRAVCALPFRRRLRSSSEKRHGPFRLRGRIWKPISQRGRMRNSVLLPVQVVYGVAAIAGFAFFLMELIWYRMLCPILGGTTFTFGLILAVALTGIALGGAAYSLFVSHPPADPLRPPAARAPGPARPLSLHGLALTSVLEGLLHRAALRPGRSPGDSGGHAAPGPIPRVSRLK